MATKSTEKKPDTVNTPAAATSENSLKVLDGNGNPITFGSVVLELSSAIGGGGGSGSNLTTLRNIDELRAKEPSAMGEMAVVLEYTSGTKMGGGVFVYDITDSSTADDGGLIFVTKGGKRWKRALGDYNDVTIVMFGAVADGKTDCAEAVNRMWKWSQQVIDGIRRYENIGIKFSAGRYYITKFDISASEVRRFRLAGENVNFGYYGTTTIVSDKKNGEYMFKVQARSVEITGFVIEGESDYANNKKNTKGFFSNTAIGGQFVRVSAMNFYTLGGRALDLVDTLDCKIDQWYANKCHGTVVYGKWSDRAEGNWDHLTAIELSNFNVQYCYDQPAIDLQRAGQSMIRNGWIEHCDDPGDISNGQWHIVALNLETNKKKLRCHFSRIISQQLSIQNGEGLDLTDSGTPWLSLYENGQTFIENYGIRANGSMNYDYLTAQEQMDNPVDAETWFCLGIIEQDQNSSQTQIQLVGSAGYSWMGETQVDFNGRSTEGGALISMQNLNGTTVAAWYGTGSSPLVRVHIVPYEGTDKNNKVVVYLKIGKFARFVKAFITTNCRDRYAGGIHFRFIKDYSKVTDATLLAKLNALTPATDNCFQQHWTGNANVGYGYNNNNELLFHVPNVTGNQLKVRVNGKLYGIALTPL